MKFRFVIGIVLLLTLKSSEGYRRALCNMRLGHWTIGDENLKLKTCFPTSNEVDNEDFSIMVRKDLSTLGLTIEKKEGVQFLPKDLFQVFPELIAIQVMYCSISSVNEQHFKDLSKLRALHLGGNKIENISSNAFTDLINLEHLELGFNEIQSLDENTFASLTALKTLHLFENNIQVLPPRIFRSLVNVEVIDLDNNDIVSLDENIFENATSLRNASLGGNELVTIPKNLFKKNLELEVVWINRNKIKFIDAFMFDRLPKLRYVVLNDNVCVNGIYPVANIDTMRIDLHQNCTENIVHETTDKSVVGKIFSAISKASQNVLKTNTD